MPWFDDKERTEAPTPNKLQKAREKGNIPVSQELAGAVQALVAVAVLSACAHGALESLGAWLRTSLERELQSAPGSMGGASVVRLAGEAGRCIVSACGPLLGALACSAVAVAVAQQGGVVVSSERVRFDPTRLDPRKNLEKVLGPAAFARMAVTLLKLVLVGAVCFLGVRTAFLQLRAGSPGSLAAGVDATSGIVFGLLWRAAGLLLAVGALDLFLARRRHTRELRMTKQEVRDEHKELEGDPLRKAHIRRIQRENRKRRGMLAAVPTA
ncbi:MAG: EscU/YscU/HrcU family type III secretion system export apparatus switch protein, partial [Planctomycetota bacterium]